MKSGQKIIESSNSILGLDAASKASRGISDMLDHLWGFTSTQISLDMSDPGDPTFRTIPLESDPNKWQIAHNYYDHADAEKIGTSFSFRATS